MKGGFLRDATVANEIFGGEVVSFRFNLKGGKKFIIAYHEGILRSPNGINYIVSGNSLKDLWDNLDYDKKPVSENDLPVINEK